MANNFKPWVDSPTAGQQVQSASVFAADTQRVDGFKAGDPASALRVNSALRQANIVVAGLMQMCDDIKTLPEGLSLMSTVTQVKNAIKAAIDQLDATVLASAKSYTDTREGVINGKITNVQTQVTSNKNDITTLVGRVDEHDTEIAGLSEGTSTLTTRVETLESEMLSAVTSANVTGESVTINNTNDGFIDEITLEGNSIGGNGTAETPIAIQSVESPISLLNCGKNIVSNNVADWEQGSVAESSNVGSTYSSVKDPSITRIRTKDLIRVKSPITFSFNSSIFDAFIVLFDENQLYLGQFLGWLPSAFTETRDCEYIAIVVRKKDDSLITASEIKTVFLQGELGLTATEYESYQGTTLSIPIKDTIGNALTLRRVGTAYDSVYKENGKWYANIKTAKATDNVANAKPNSAYLGTTGNGTASETGTITVTGEVVYELATPEIIELHEDTASALESLKTYKGTTNIFGINTVNSILDITELAMSISKKKYALLTDSDGNVIMPVNEADNVIMRDGRTVEQSLQELSKISITTLFKSNIGVGGVWTGYTGDYSWTTILPDVDIRGKKLLIYSGHSKDATDNQQTGRTIVIPKASSTYTLFTNDFVFENGLMSKYSIYLRYSVVDGLQMSSRPRFVKVDANTGLFIDDTTTFPNASVSQYVYAIYQIND